VLAYGSTEENMETVWIMSTRTLFSSTARRFGLPLLAATTLGAIVGCGNGSSAIENLDNVQRGQAIDGYIVGGAVYCDGARNGRTLASGRFSCPEFTRLIQIRGGGDVGFDESAIGGGTPFLGELKAPGGSAYVTPLTTLATNMASANGPLDSQSYTVAEETLAVSLNLPGLDLNDSPVTNIDIAKTNAKVNQLVSIFATNVDEYTRVSEQLSVVLNTTNSFDLTNETPAMVDALNRQLTMEEPRLAMAAIDQSLAIETLESTNADIDRALSVDQIDVVVEQNVINDNTAFAIDKSEGLVRFVGPSTVFGPYSNLYDFQNATLFTNGYKVNKGFDTQRVEFLTSAFTVKKTFNGVPLDLAIEFVSTTPGDNRRMSVTMSNAFLAMLENDNTNNRRQRLFRLR